MNGYGDANDMKSRLFRFINIYYPANRHDATDARSYRKKRLFTQYNVVLQ